MLAKLNLLNIITLIVAVAFLILMTLPLYLSRKLNHIFDPKFKDLIHITPTATLFPNQLRALVYATWVTSPKYFGTDCREVRNFEFRHRISRSTHILCCILTGAYVVLVGLGIPFGCYSAYLKHFSK